MLGQILLRPTPLVPQGTDTVTMTALGLAAAVNGAGHDVVGERPDVVLTDAIRNGVPTVVAVSEDASRRHVLGLLADDAAGIATLYAGPAELGLAIDSAANGWVWIDPRTAGSSAPGLG